MHAAEPVKVPKRAAVMTDLLDMLARHLLVMSGLLDILALFDVLAGRLL